VVVPGARVAVVPDEIGDRTTLLALAATAHHALAGAGRLPDLIVGHGALGRLLARLAVLRGADPAPTVWERDPARRGGAAGYAVLDADADPRRDYRAIYDASGDPALLDGLVARLARGGEIVLAGFYGERLSFAFAPAFLREARLRVAAEWLPDDLAAVASLAARGLLSLDDLITHRSSAVAARGAYRTAFASPECIKMVLDWRECA
jgi:3-hydroxyethyl bacteriochlorophyllide a dehydrogenase